MNFRRLAAAVFLAALTLRAGVQLAKPVPVPVADAASYDELARHVIEGRGYVGERGLPTAKRPPGYTAFAVANYAVFGGWGRGMQLVQAVLDALSCVFVLLLGRRLFDDKVALVAAALTAVSLSQIAATRVLLSETLATFLVLGALLLTHIGLDEDTRRRPLVLAAAGAVWGLAVLVKGTFLPYPFLVAVVAWAAPPRRLAVAVPRWLILIGGFALALAPWAARNHVVFHRFIPVATQSGQVMYSSWNPPGGRIMGVYVDDEVSRRILTTLPEPDQSAAFRRAAVDHLKAHPGAVPRLVVVKLINLFVPLDWELLPPPGGSAVLNPTYAFELPFILVGVILLLRRRGAAAWADWLLWVVLGGLLFMTVATYGSPRLRIPLEPALHLVAALGLVAVIRRDAAPQRPRRFIFLAAWAVTVLVLYLASDSLRALGRSLLS